MNKLAFVFLLTSLLISGCSRGRGGDSSSIPPAPGEAIDLDIYSINDFHGAISPRQIEYYYEGGISRFATYLKSKVATNPDNSIFVNAGDLWQDTYDSAMNKGELLTKAMSELGCEAMALGNHEFDWGLDAIKHNKEVAETYRSDHQFTFLGANIYNYDGSNPTSHADDLCSPYKVIERSGIKIGIIGGIGVNQLTSITSTNWENITFVNPVNIVKDTSDMLRKDENCDVILYLYHGSLDDSSYGELSKTSKVTGKRYVDAGFLGHTHHFEDALSNGAVWTQSYQHGSVLGHVKLRVYNKTVSCVYRSTYENKTDNGFGSGDNSIYKSSEDTSMSALVNSYLTDSFIESRDEVVGKVQNSDTNLGRKVGGMQAYMTSKYIDDLRLENPQIPNIDVVINNGNRTDVELKNNGNIRRVDVFNLIPFPNRTVIAKVKGKDIRNECINYENPYYLPGETSLHLNDNTEYTVAVVDYLLFHKSVERYYNYFPSYRGTPLYTIDKMPYEIVIDYFKANSTYDLAIQSQVGFVGLS